LLPFNTLLAVVTFPGDLFYPVGVTSLGMFVRKGMPHNPKSKVLWIRALNDGLLKSKGKRLPNARAKDDLEEVRDTLRAFLNNPQHTVKAVNQFIKLESIDLEDKQLELVPEAYLDQSEPTHAEVMSGMEAGIRDLFAYLIKTGRAELRSDLIRTSAPTNARPKAWKTFLVTDFFNLARGHFHSIANLDPGTNPTISRVSTDNGLVGFYDKPEKAKIWPSGTITVSTVTGDAFVQPVPFIATDNVVLCCPKPNYEDAGLEWRLFAQLMINQMKWRYSYGRQCYKRKFAKTEIVMPVTEMRGGGQLDLEYMKAVVHSATYWPLVEHVFKKWFLGRPPTFWARDIFEAKPGYPTRVF